MLKGALKAVWELEKREEWTRSQTLDLVMQANNKTKNGALGSVVGHFPTATLTSRSRTIPEDPPQLRVRRNHHSPIPPVRYHMRPCMQSLQQEFFHQQMVAWV